MESQVESQPDMHLRVLQCDIAYANGVIATLREPFLILDKSLRIRTANSAFYLKFHTSKEETEGHFLYDLGNRQWDIACAG